MRAAYIEATGPPDVIQIGDLPMPEVGPRQCLIQVAASAVNPIDTYVRGGMIAAELPRPFVIGSDLAGEVIAVGSEVTAVKVGDAVWGSNQGLLGRQGTCAEYCAVDAEWIYPVPANVELEAAAAMALVGITSHLGLFERARVTRADTLLVHGGSGGVGGSVVQMAKCVGARVIATAGSHEKGAICRELGADEVILYREEDEMAAVERLAPTGVDVIWETSRDPDLDRLVAMLAERGRLVLMAGRDARPTFPVGPFYVKQCEIHGFVMFKASAETQRRSANQINDWMSHGQLQPRIAHRLPIGEAARAHQLQEEATLHGGGVPGKIVIVP